MTPRDVALRILLSSVVLMVAAIPPGRRTFWTRCVSLFRKSIRNVVRPFSSRFGLPRVGETQEVDVSFADGESESLYVTCLAPNRYRLEETPVSLALGELDVPVFLGDVIDVEPVRGRGVRFVRVAERASQQHEWWIVPPFFFRSEPRQTFWATIAAEGGTCEGIFNFLFVHLPTETSFDVKAELDHCIAEAALLVPNDGSDLGEFRHAVRVDLDDDVNQETTI